MIFGKIGESTQYVQSKATGDLIEMNGERPSSDHVASENGEWVISQESLIDKAKITLATALSSDIESSGYTWQVRNAIDLQNIQDAIDEHNYAELASDVTQSFRMSDNTWQDITVDEFEKVLSDYRLRKKELYEKYKSWTSGDMLEDFAI